MAKSKKSLKQSHKKAAQKPKQMRNPEPSNDDRKPEAASAKEAFRKTYVREPDKITNAKTGRTLLIDAIIEGNAEKAAWLLEAGASPNKEMKDGTTPLHFAIRAGATGIADLLLDRGAIINPRDKNGKTPLFDALDAPDALAAVTFMLEAGAVADAYDDRNRNALHYAAESAKLPVVQKLLEYTENPARPDDRGNQPLHLACDKNTLDVVQAILFERVPVFTSSNDGDTCLHLAAGRADKSTEIAEYLLKTEGAGLVNAVNIYGRTPLHLALLHKHESLAVSMIDAGASVNIPDKQGATPLHDAAEIGNVKLARMLIENGADVAKSQEIGRVTPLILAIKGGHKEVVDLLLSFDASPTAADRDGQTPLIPACHKGSDAIAGTLLSAGADATPRDKMGRNVLQHCAPGLSEETLGKLIDAGAEPDGQDTWKRTPLVSSIMDHNTALTKVLLERGVDVNAKDDQGNSALHLALQRRKLDIIDLLLEKGADPNVTDKWSKQTALHVACNLGLETEVGKLAKAGADLKAKDNQGRTPLHTAVLNSYSSAEMVRVLLEAGADPLAQDNQKNTPYDMAHGLDKRAAETLIKNRLSRLGKGNVKPKKYNPYGYYGGGF